MDSMYRYHAYIDILYVYLSFMIRIIYSLSILYLEIVNAVYMFKLQ